MREQSLIRKQIIKNMLYNFLAFTLVFSAFGLIIFFQMSTALYSEVDNDLMKTEQLMQNNANVFNDQLTNTKGPKDQTLLESGNNDKPIKGDDKREPINPRITAIIRDSDGTVLNTDRIGKNAYEDYFQNIPFTTSDANGVITPLVFQESNFQYRSLSFPVSYNGTEYYVQLLINVNGEQNALNNFVQTLSICVVLFIILAVIISYILSRRTMKPILEAWKRQTEFVENASHELRTPLTVIQNKQELLLTQPNKKIIDESEAIAITLNEVRRLSKLTSDLLTLARAESGQTELEKETFDLNEMIRMVCAPFMEIAEAQDKVMQLDLAGQLHIRADKARIHQLLIILLDNALKYTNETDSITVSATINDNKIELVVSDTGLGVSETGLTNIFHRFYREDKARTREQGGTGLGLSIAAWIVESHNGSIRAEHNKPKGTQFIIKLPK